MDIHRIINTYISGKDYNQKDIEELVDTLSTILKNKNLPPITPEQKTNIIQQLIHSKKIKEEMSVEKVCKMFGMKMKCYDEKPSLLSKIKSLNISSKGIIDNKKRKCSGKKQDKNNPNYLNRQEMIDEIMVRYGIPKFQINNLSPKEMCSLLVFSNQKYKLQRINDIDFLSYNHLKDVSENVIDEKLSRDENLKNIRNILSIQLAKKLINIPTTKLRKIYQEKTNKSVKNKYNEELIFEILKIDGVNIEAFNDQINIFIRNLINEYKNDRELFIKSLPHSKTKSLLKELDKTEMETLFDEIKKNKDKNAFMYLQEYVITTKIQKACNCVNKCEISNLLINLPCIQKINQNHKLLSQQIKVLHEIFKNKKLVVVHSSENVKNLSIVSSVQMVLAQPKNIKKIIIATSKSSIEPLQKQFEKYGTEISNIIQILSYQTLARRINNKKIKINSNTFLIIDEFEQTLLAKTIVPSSKQAGKLLLLTDTKDEKYKEKYSVISI